MGYNIIFSNEEDLLLGSGGGIAKAQSHLNNKDGFLVINADEVILPKKPNVMTDFVSYAQDNNSLANLMVMKHPEAGTKFNAVWAEEESGLVIDFGKIKPHTNKEVIPYHFIGPMHLKNRIFDRLKIEPSNIIHDILKKSMKEGEVVKVFPH